MTTPCYTNKTHCPNRRVGCHSECPEWQKFEEFKAQKYKDAESTRYIGDVEYSRRTRIVTRRNQA